MSNRLYDRDFYAWANQQTGFDRATFPADCPYTFEQAMNPDFWPE
ncbi:MAG TPA: DUF29 family protein [Acetobacteraceae bacterium]